MESQQNRNLGLVVIGYFILLFLFVYIVNVLVGVLPNFAMRHFGASESFRVFVGSTFGYGVRIAASVVLSFWVVRRVLKLDAKNLMFPTFRGWWMDIVFGIGLVFLILALIVAFEVAIGWLEIEGWTWQQVPIDAFLRNLWLGLLVNLSVAVGEETLFRGYYLTGLIMVWGKAIGFLVMSLVFAAMHLLITGADATSILVFIPLLAIPGLVLGWTFIQTRSLWLAISIHFAWDLVQDELLNMHGRGTPQLFGAVTKQTGPAWIVGTSYGIEVAALGVIAWVLVVLGVWVWVRNRQYPSIDGLSHSVAGSD
jgi:membrane protease YdiL (CAAX protease family)